MVRKLYSIPTIGAGNDHIYVKKIIKMRMSQELMQFSVTHVVNGCIIPIQASLENQGVISGFAKIVNKVA